MSAIILTLKKQITDLKEILHSHLYEQQFNLYSRVELIHTLLRCGRTNVEDMSREFLSEYPEYSEEFISYYNIHKTLMPLPEDPSKDPKNPLRVEYESLMGQMMLLIDQLHSN
jgi:hypothetical protein